MQVRIKQAAVVASDTQRFILARVCAVDEVKQQKQFLVKASECVVRVERAVAQALDETPKGKVVQITPVCASAVRLHRQQPAALGIKNKEQPVKKRERVVIDFRKVTFAEMIVLKINKTSPQVFQHVENSVS